MPLVEMYGVLCWMDQRVVGGRGRRCVEVSEVACGLVDSARATVEAV